MADTEIERASRQTPGGEPEAAPDTADDRDGRRGDDRPDTDGAPTAGTAEAARDRSDADPSEPDPSEPDRSESDAPESDRSEPDQVADDAGDDTDADGPPAADAGAATDAGEGAAAPGTADTVDTDTGDTGTDDTGTGDTDAGDVETVDSASATGEPGPGETAETADTGTAGTGAGSRKRDGDKPSPPPPRRTGLRGVLARMPLVQRGDVPPELEGLVAAIREDSPKVDVREVIRAHAYARDAHQGQMRKSGDPYISHPIAVATELAELGLDTSTIVAALLHDVVEDTGAETSEIADYFSDEVARLVDGVTKLDELQVESKREQQAETLRKMILAMAEDIRVLVIKLADRLHNMATIEHMPREAQLRIARETLDIYAPLAHRLGMQQFRVRLEDLGFQTVHPKRYEEIVAMVSERQPKRQGYIDRVIDEVRDQLKEIKVKAEVTGRPKHYHSIYEKMVHGDREFDEIYDLVGIRIITSSVRDCYAVLGQIHAAWRPVPGRFKDYIAMPKFNLYQSLHTVVVGPEGRPLEIQIRTRAMHHTAEYGVAAHWKYKEAARTGKDDLQWLEQMLDWQDDVHAPDDYLDALKIDLYQDEVFVFTPQGDVISLPDGATPIDFAYAIHTEVGHACIGARVNDRLTPLDHKLDNGDVVEILTSKAADAGPSRDWMELAASTRAQSKIRAYFNRERREDAMERGREAIVRALRKVGLGWERATSSGAFDQVVDDLSYKTRDALFQAVGDRHVSPSTVADHVTGRIQEDEPEPDEPDLPSPSPVRIDATGTDRIEVEGDTGMLATLARCCTPVPGDSIVGYVTRGRGVSVHRSDCPDVAELQNREPERFVPVAWSGEEGAAFLVTVQVEALDRKHLLRDITEVLGDLHINITSAQVTTRQDRVAILRFSFELADPAHLDYALESVHSVEGVYDAYRVVPQAARDDEEETVDA